MNPFQSYGTSFEILLQTDDSTLKRICGTIYNRQIQKICSSTIFWQKRLEYFFGPTALLLKYPRISFRDWYFLLSEDKVGDILQLTGSVRVIRKYTEQYVTEGSRRFQDDILVLVKAIKQGNTSVRDSLLESIDLNKLSIVALQNILEAALTVDDTIIIDYLSNNDLVKRIDLFGVIDQRILARLSSIELSYILARLLDINAPVKFFKQVYSMYLRSNPDDRSIEWLLHHSLIKNEWLSQRILEDFTVSQQVLASAALYAGKLDLAGDYQNILTDQEIFRSLLKSNPELALKYSAGESSQIEIEDSDYVNIAEIYEIEIESAEVLAKFIDRFGQDNITSDYIKVDCNNLIELQKMITLLNDKDEATLIYYKLIKEGCYEVFNLILANTELSTDDITFLIENSFEEGYLDLAAALIISYNLRSILDKLSEGTNKNKLIKLLNI